MKILVAIASYGTRNDRYLARLLQEYRGMPFAVDIIVFSNIPKEVAPGVKVVVGLPSKDPWSLPFAHQQVFQEKMKEYDVFIYSEDDMLVSERNIRSFLRVQEALPEDEIAGFLRYEIGQSGSHNYPEMHADFHWDPRSVRRRGEFALAHFTNEHSACYVAGRKQLERAIESGGFIVKPHSERYDLLCTAATDIYTQCGMRRLVCVSHVDDFLVHHLPNKYVGSRFGIGESAFRAQIEALLEIQDGTQRSVSLLPTLAQDTPYPKHYFEQADVEIPRFIPPGARSLLSVGCGWGATEAALGKNRLQVTAIPLDCVVGACAQAIGVECTPPDFDAALKYLEGRKFDVLLISNLLHLVEDPARFVSRSLNLLSEGGSVVVRIPNVARRSLVLSKMQARGRDREIRNAAKGNAVRSSRGDLLSWCEAAGLRARSISGICSGKSKRWQRITVGLLDRWLASDIVAVFVADSSTRSHLGNTSSAVADTHTASLSARQMLPRV